MNLKKAAQGFTLVEMLVVIAIIAILAASLFPAIQSAMDMARANSLKSRGRGIWTAINTANSDREPLGKYSLWPKDLQEKKKDKIGSSSLKYWQFLFSKGDGNAQDDAEMQLVGDLTCSSLAANGIPTAAKPSEIKEENIAWRVAEVNANTAGELPFIVTKNYARSGDFSGDDGVGDDDDDGDITIIDLDPNEKPFGDKRAVWVTIGGATKDARKRDFDAPTFLGNTAIKDGDKLTIWEM